MTYGGTLFAAYWAQHASRLPAGYREVEYIESTGTQYIDTGYVIKSGDVSVRMDLMLTQNYTFWNGGFIFGVRGDNSHTLFSCAFPSATQVRLAVSRDAFANYAIKSVGDGARHILDYGAGYIDIDGTNYAVASYPFRTSNATPLFIFARASHESAPTIVGGIRCYGFDLLKGGVSMRRLVPCVRVADNKPGMYDLCGSISAKTGTSFYVNEGTGADFTWGELS